MGSALVEFNPEADSLEAESFEASGLAPAPEASVLDEAEEMELAAELLELGDEPGVARFLDRLLRAVARDCGRRLDERAARELAGLLRAAARQVLASLRPERAAPAAVRGTGQVFGLELEGLSDEDREFETAKALVRLAESAARRLATAPPAGSPERAAQQALAQAARRHAPGLAAPPSSSASSSPSSSALSSPASMAFPTGDRSIAPRVRALTSQESTMHDIDRTTLEFGQQESQFGSFGQGEFGQAEYGQGEFGQGEFGQGEYGQGGFGQGEWSGEGPYELLGEGEQLEMAAELLSVGNEAELDRFLGDLVKKVGQVAGQAIRSPVGQALIPVLKGAAAKALPLAGGALGGYLGGPLGAKIGTGIANAAGQALGLEAEALSGEDREFEGAKQFVKLAAQTVQNAASAPPGAPPAQVAQSAAVAAARALAPGLVSGAAQAGGARPPMAAGSGAQPPMAGRRGSGRWVRKGRVIVLLGA